MNADTVAEFLESLARCRRKGTAERPAWYVDNRLVARLEDRTTLTIRCAPSLREELTAAHPETFGVPPAMEAHHKVQASLTHGNDMALRRALEAAYRMQRKA
ncbi:MmcQ/YjbR family DNA-binding protein [Nocardioides jensenii]|uniref:MmcQ/YjbR family DNA-binding protein n=1 Tax=Nocardioides jensenii TaxID=1843 RepID=UPI00083376B1|nr:MmcQ/YjbR family DNA-binding protein [Nocardioides jensenii]